MATYNRENFLADDLHVSIFAPMAVLVGITVYICLVFSVVIYKWAAGKTYRDLIKI